MEEGLGYKLINAQVGGAGGGGAELTEQGRDLMKRFRAFEQGLHDEIDDRFETTFWIIALIPVIARRQSRRSNSQ